MKNTNINVLTFSGEEYAAPLALANGLKDIIKAAAYTRYGYTNMVQKFSLDNYNEEMNKNKKAILGYCKEV